MLFNFLFGNTSNFVNWREKTIEIEYKSGYRICTCSGVNFTNVLCVAFVPIFLCQKLQSKNVTSCAKHFGTKNFSLKCWWNLLSAKEWQFKSNLSLRWCVAMIKYSYNPLFVILYTNKSLVFSFNYYKRYVMCYFNCGGFQ